VNAHAGRLTYRAVADALGLSDRFVELAALVRDVESAV
jgi:hypothetical protein